MPDDWDQGRSVEARIVAESLIVDVDGFEGPLDLLLMLSRTQKVDLRRISVLQLAEQYLEFVNQAKALRIELAADYLVMAAWLAYLKSRLLLPPDPTEAGPTADELAAHLAFQLERLQAMREAAARLMARDRKGRDFFARGIPEDVMRIRRVRHSATLLDLMQAYARTRTRDEFRPFVMDRQHVYTMEQALDRMRGLIGYAGDWTDLVSYLPDTPILILEGDVIPGVAPSSTPSFRGHLRHNPRVRDGEHQYDEKMRRREGVCAFSRVNRL